MKTNTTNPILIFFFILFQLFGDIPLGVGQRLLADPRLGNLVLVRVADFDIITEDIVVAYLQAGNLRQLTLALLYLQQIILTGVGYLAQLVQLGTNTGLDDTALINQQRRVIVYLPVYAVADGLADVQLLAI